MNEEGFGVREWKTKKNTSSQLSFREVILPLTTLLLAGSSSSSSGTTGRGRGGGGGGGRAHAAGGGGGRAGAGAGGGGSGGSAPLAGHEVDAGGGVKMHVAAGVLPEVEALPAAADMSALQKQQLGRYLADQK